MRNPGRCRTTSNSRSWERSQSGMSETSDRFRMWKAGATTCATGAYGSGPCASWLYEQVPLRFA
eukprot:674742-Pyramimonas_sp.AAC.1